MPPPALPTAPTAPAASTGTGHQATHMVIASPRKPNFPFYATPQRHPVDYDELHPWVVKMPQPTETDRKQLESRRLQAQKVMLFMLFQ